MKFNKKDFVTAVKQVKNIGKDMLIHLHNENNKTYLFTTNGVSTAKAYFDTEIADIVDICLNAKDFQQVCKIRGDLNFTIEDKKIEFFDEKTKMVFVLQDWSGLVDAEKASIVPENVKNSAFEATELFKIFSGVSYASNPKDTQNPFITGVNYELNKNGIIKFVSTDRTRIACWESNEQNLIDDEGITAIFPSTIAENLAFFDDDVKIIVDDNKIILTSEKFELFCPKINAQFPDVSKFFNQNVTAEYVVDSAEVKTSLDIICDNETNAVQLVFDENTLEISTYPNEMSSSDKIECSKISGEGKETVVLCPKMLKEALTKILSKQITIKFLGDKKLFAYYADGFYGMIAPKTR